MLSFLGFIVKKVSGFGSVDTEKEIGRHNFFAFIPVLTIFMRSNYSKLSLTFGRC